MPERGFFNFLNLFAIFFWNFLARVECERNSGLKFFSLFVGLSYPVLAKNNAGEGFFNFLNFLAFFFRNFLALVESVRNSGIIFFFLFLGLSQPVLDRNNVRINFFNFLNFFYYFLFVIFLLGLCRNGIRE